jgi:hypothetical protein
MGRGHRRVTASRAAFSVEPERLAKELIDHLTNEVAVRALADITAHTNKRGLPGIIDARFADQLNIEGGREDLQSYAPDLYRILDAIPDDHERNAAYMALHGIVRGTLNIAKSGIYPLDEMRHSNNLQAAASRVGQARRKTARYKIVKSVIDEAKQRGRQRSTRLLLDDANARLKAAGHSQISLATWYRIKIYFLTLKA